MKQENLEEKVKYSRIKIGVGIAALAASALGGAYAIFREPSPTIESSMAAESDPKDNPIENKNPVINDNPKPVETEYVSKYDYRIKDGSLEVYKKDTEDTETPDFKIDLPHRYSQLSKNLKKMEESADNHPRKKVAARYFYDRLLKYKEEFQEISSEDKMFESLDPEERVKAAKSVNENLISCMDKLLDYAMPAGKYEIESGILMVYKEKPSNPNNPDIKIILPERYLKLSKKIENMERHIKLGNYYGYKEYFHKNLSEERANFKEITPDDEALQSLNPEEREIMARFVNDYLTFHLNKVIEELEPESIKTEEGINGSDIF